MALKTCDYVYNRFDAIDGQKWYINIVRDVDVRLATINSDSIITLSMTSHLAVVLATTDKTGVLIQVASGF